MDSNLIKDYVRTLSLKSPKQSPVLIGFVGPLASGKTFLGKKMAQDFNFVFLQVEEIKKLLIPRPEFLNQGQTLISEFILASLEELYKSSDSVVTDFNFAKKADRDHFRLLAPEKKTILIELQCPKEVLMTRIETRNEQINKGTQGGRITGEEDLDLEKGTIESPVSADFTFNSASLDDYPRLKSQIEYRVNL